MSSEPTTFTEIVNERSTSLYKATLVDELSQPIGLPRITALILTLSNVVDGSVVNSRNGQNALNANDVTVSVDGELVFVIQPSDVAIVDTQADYEAHRATFHVFYDLVSEMTWDVDINIRNLSQVA